MALTSYAQFLLIGFMTDGTLRISYFTLAIVPEEQLGHLRVW